MCFMVTKLDEGQWCRSVVKYGWGQGQSGQAIKLFQITPYMYVNDFQKLEELVLP